MNFGKSLKGISRSLQVWSNFFKGIRPKSNFQDFRSPQAPNYHLLEHWACHPKSESKVFFKPEDTPDSDLKVEHAVDTFFVYPTTFFGNFNWNAPLDHLQSKQLVDDVVIPSQASVFNTSTTLFAPRYRQATFYSFLSGGNNAKKALDFAYEDVKNAFEFYLKNYNNGKPFILAGHSQGSILGLRLLEDYVEGKALYKQLIAAYLPGYKIPAHKFDIEFKSIKAGEHKDMIHCILAWDAFLDQRPNFSFLDNALTWVTEKDGSKSWKKRIGIKVWGCNPLSWTTNQEQVEKTQVSVSAQFRKNKFLQWLDLSDNEQTGITLTGLNPPSEHAITVQRKEDGLIYIQKPKDRLLNIGLLPGGNYHVHDYNLFYMSIKKNVHNRIKNYFETYPDMKLHVKP